MASRGSLRPLTEELAREILSAAPAGKGWPLYLTVESAAEPDGGTDLVLCYLIFVRAGGMMLAIPKSDFVHATIQDSEASSEGAPEFSTVVVDMESSRGRRLGSSEVELVDLPWAFAPMFLVSSKIGLLRGGSYIGFEIEGQPVRPVRDSLQDLATSWIAGTMEEDTAQEYLTGEEVPPSPTPPDEAQATQAAVLESQQARIAELEKLLAESQASARLPKAPSSSTVLPTSKAPGLFPDQARRPRVGSVEDRRQAPSRQVLFQDQTLAEVEKEAEEPGLADQMLDVALPAATASSDPLAQILAVQLQQNKLMMERLLGHRQTDPVLGALSGGDSGSGSNSSGVKGCLAREAFLKAASDLPRVATVARTNALRELGLDDSRCEANLMKKYIERRIPLGDHKLLSYWAVMCAEGWSVAHQSGNIELQGIMARMLTFIEQAAIDAGKYQLAWLLTTPQEPPWHLLVKQKWAPGLQPFSRLCHPSWVKFGISERSGLRGKPQSIDRKACKEFSCRPGRRGSKAEKTTKENKRSREERGFHVRSGVASVASGGIVCGSRTFEGASPTQNLQSSPLDGERINCSPVLEVCGVTPVFGAF